MNMISKSSTFLSHIQTSLRDDILRKISKHVINSKLKKNDTIKILWLTFEGHHFTALQTFLKYNIAGQKHTF